MHEPPELGDAFVEQCFGHLDETRRAALRETLHAWFAAQGSTDAAAEALFVHRNTLRYRLRSFTESTGLSLDRPEDAFTVWWAMRRLDELKRRPRSRPAVGTDAGETHPDLRVARTGLWRRSHGLPHPPSRRDLT